MKKNKLKPLGFERLRTKPISIKYGLWIILPLLLSSLFFPGCKKNNSIDGTTNHAQLGKNGTRTSASIPVLSDSQLGFDSWYNAYVDSTSSTVVTYWADQPHTLQATFWTTAEMAETQIDAYNVNPTQKNKNRVQYIYNGFINANGLLWTSDTYNDDIMWASIMAVRAYAITNDTTQLSVAKNNFNMAWNRGYSTDLGGGLWWNTGDSCKNACVNGPGAICAMLLYKATGDTTYKYKAKLLLDWLVATLYVPSTGQIIDHISKSTGVASGGQLTYNQGTFVGAADLLMPYYTGSNYLAEAKNVMNYTKNTMCMTAGGLLPSETSTGDCYGMKSIFARWACVFVHDSGDIADYGSWLDYNAATVWSMRNNYGLMWQNWSLRALDLPILNSWGCDGGVSMILNVHRFN